MFFFYFQMNPMLSNGINIYLTTRCLVFTSKIFKNGLLMINK